VVVGVEREAAEVSCNSSTVDKSSGGREGSMRQGLTTPPPPQLLHGGAGVKALDHQLLNPVEKPSLSAVAASMGRSFS